ncbi:MAG: hypothetical protein FJZ38_19560 [Candidatus Rokubacteria bacterium]|nr:hypothetical protein [Candidatus Rokubacteria bacterium]
MSAVTHFSRGRRSHSPSERNLGLGERRARATMNYLVGQGVQASRISIISYSEERPICSEKTESCWAQNRRAAFLVKEQ